MQALFYFLVFIGFAEPEPECSRDDTCQEQVDSSSRPVAGEVELGSGPLAISNGF